MGYCGALCVWMHHSGLAKADLADSPQISGCEVYNRVVAGLMLRMFSGGVGDWDAFGCANGAHTAHHAAVNGRTLWTMM